uniref:ARF GTPase-activating protein GIT2-like isoform X2 n=1 Tax=Crassostrea virginica TaxID=6565 RepID=A0A8B8EJ51_CRAVI|nr:ARF GTPase-activating protein GIT2-like isoform X2 [Crassostrea virginica]
MSRTKVRTASEVCADCTASDPTWASINRGVLICDECCSVHRSLGRHISQVKSLTKGQWSPTLLAMVQHLANHGANSIWEHSLLDPSQSKHGKKKPSPRDQVHPVKTEFIRSKYQFLQFVNKQKDGELNSIDDLSKQLHSSVRTNNLETCLRLLSKGADPNYFHPEKGNCPLHVAAQSGQPLQVELLIVYGADPGAYDSNGKTPIDHAKVEGHMDLADRLVECQYELTDRLAFYLCQRKPDHRTGVHFKIPEMADSSLDMSELAKQAKKKLQALPNHLFEELAMDVYDEVDRRENDEHWLQTHDNKALVSDRQGVPFLPLNPDFSATRNQGRQKLARFNAREFATLIIDILNDAKRRQTGVMSPVQTPKEPDKLPSQVVQRKTNFNSIASDEEPIYDQVASDEDYSSIDNLSIKSAGMKESALAQPPAVPQKSTQRQNSAGNLRSKGDLIQAQVYSVSPLPPSISEAVVEGPVSTEEFLQMKKKLSTMEFRMQQILKTNQDLQKERDELTQLVQTLTKEISILRNQTQRQQSPSTALPNGYSQTERGEETGRTSTPRSGTRPSSGTRPQSMFEPREREQRLSNKTPSKDSLPTAYSVSNIHKSDESDSNRVQSSSSGSGAEEIQCAYPPDLSHYDCPSSLPVSLDEELPSQEEVMRKTEKITKNIQELHKSGQDGKHDSFGHCADKIYEAVKEMAALFPKNSRISTVRHALNSLTSSAARLQEECQDGNMGELDPELDLPFKTQQVMQCAFDIARAAKELVTLFQ